MRLRGALAILIALAGSAGARGPDGLLAIVIQPNNGVPAVVRPGDTFEAVLTQKAPLSLVSDSGKTQLSAEWSEIHPGRFAALCMVPADAAPGAYAIEAQAGDEPDTNGRAVYVRADIPSTYRFAHVTDTHIGSNRHPRSSEDILGDEINALKEEEPDFAVFTGDLTENGTLEQFQRFLTLLDTCPFPTYVCAGNHDRKALNYEQTFGPVIYTFKFGEDGYLAFDTKDYVTAAGLDNHDARLHQLRRAIKPSRWSIGLTHRFNLDLGIRCQLTAFVDNPLDHVFVGHEHRENREDEKRVPWGRTGITLTPAGIDGFVRLVEVAPGGIKPGPVERMAVIKRR